jgi:hypothetical protein
MKAFLIVPADAGLEAQRTVDAVRALTAGKAEVKLITFTAWGGFFEETFVISRSFPHALLRHDRKCLVEYNCGIIF